MGCTALAIRGQVELKRVDPPEKIRIHIRDINVPLEGIGKVYLEVELRLRDLTPVDFHAAPQKDKFTYSGPSAIEAIDGMLRSFYVEEEDRMRFLRTVVI